ncbi:MAG: hypothetical protein K2P48_02430, partial [Lachnospiraceae bacterium]|nr:hypothetical protein [Lachnospiraceae bacterium]
GMKATQQGMKLILYRPCVPLFTEGTLPPYRKHVYYRSHEAKKAMAAKNINCHGLPVRQKKHDRTAMLIPSTKL